MENLKTGNAHTSRHRQLFLQRGLSRSAELQMRHGSSCWEADLVLEAAEMGVLLERLSQVSVPNKFSTPTC